MKLSCLQENLKNALNIVDRSTSQNSTLPILSNILLATENNYLKISATNLEVGITVSIPSKIEKTGEVCVYSKLINGFIDNINNGKVDMNLINDNLLNIKKDEYSANITTSDAKNFPIIPKIKTSEKIKIKQRDIKNGINGVINSVSLSDLKPELTGIYFNFDGNNLKIAATDSFRLSEKNIYLDSRITGNKSFILPLKTSQELSRLLADDGDSEVVLNIDKNQIIFEFNNIQLFSKLIDGQYPDYNQIIPKKFKTRAAVDKKEFLNTLKVASVFCGKANDIKINVVNKNIEVVSRDAEKGENINKIKTDIDGMEIEIAFNCRYLMDGLNNISGEVVILNFNEKNTPVLITDQKNSNYFYLIMPIRSV